MENTKRALSECLESVEVREHLSKNESVAFSKMVEMMYYFLNDMNLIDFENECLDEETLKELCKDLENQSISF